MSRDGIAGLICLAGALVLWVAGRGLPQPVLVPIGPAYYPRLLFIVVGVLSAALVVTDVVGQRRGGARPAASSARYRLVVLTFVIFALYVVMLPALGFRLATLLFVGGLQVVLEPPQGRRWWLVLAVALGTTVLTYYVFERYLSVLLPRGRLTGF
ncbi:MAG TPA: tripartite tricarboxylate transporter TctB family protein [Gemmatimonadales bacterium]|nr:tripartite tricarboxylate transporter TctB family protein [Gemmatimonadales bacterium]